MPKLHFKVSDPKEVYSGKRVADKPLTEDQMIGETLAILAGNYRVWSAATYWERNKFTNRTYFAPYAYKLQPNTRKFRVEDLARLNKTGKPSSASIYNINLFLTILQRSFTRTSRSLNSSNNAGPRTSTTWRSIISRWGLGSTRPGRLRGNSSTSPRSSGPPNWSTEPGRRPTTTVTERCPCGRYSTPPPSLDGTAWRQNWNLSEHL